MTDEERIRPRPKDPVIDFIYDKSVPTLIMRGSNGWPYSRLSRSRLDKIAYKLIALRCAQLGIDQPTRKEAEAWKV